MTSPDIRNSPGSDFADLADLADPDPPLSPVSVLPLEGHPTRPPNPRALMHSGLGKLPPEIRCMIWRFVCTTPPKTNVLVDHDVSCPALLQICRLINQEAEPIYYANTPFYFTIFQDFSSFLRKIGLDRCKFITKIHVGFITYGKNDDTDLKITQMYKDLDASNPLRRFFILQPGQRNEDIDRAVRDLQRCNSFKRFLSKGLHQAGNEAAIMRDLVGLLPNYFVEIIDGYCWRIKLMSFIIFEPRLRQESSSFRIGVHIEPSALEGLYSGNDIVVTSV